MIEINIFFLFFNYSPVERQVYWTIKGKTQVNINSFKTFKKYNFTGDIITGGIIFHFNSKFKIIIH